MLVDDVYVLWCIGVEFGEGCGDFVDQFVVDGGICQYIVGCNVCLFGVEQFDLGDLFGCDIYIGIGCDDYWVFVVEFEGDWGQVWCGVFVDFVVDFGVIGEYYVVEILSDQFLIYCIIVLYDCDCFGVEIVIY